VGLPLSPIRLLEVTIMSTLFCMVIPFVSKVEEKLNQRVAMDIGIPNIRSVVSTCEQDIDIVASNKV
jgi:hypothetical protein